MFGVQVRQQAAAWLIRQHDESTFCSATSVSELSRPWYTTRLFFMLEILYESLRKCLPA